MAGDEIISKQSVTQHVTKAFVQYHVTSIFRHERYGNVKQLYILHPMINFKTVNTSNEI
jgi:hypothetical protein